MRNRNEDKINLRGSKRSGFNIELAARGSGLSSRVRAKITIVGCGKGLD